MKDKHIFLARILIGRWQVLLRNWSRKLRSGGRASLGRRDWNFKPVSEPLLGDDIQRMGGIFLDLLSQLIDDDPKMFGFLGVIRSPHSLQDSLVSQRFVMVNHKEPKDVELFGREMNPVSANLNQSAVEIDY